MFSWDFRKQQGAKSKHIFEIEEGKRLKIWSAACLLACPLVAGVPALWGFRTCRKLALVLWSCVPSFCLLSRFVFGALSLNMALFRVLRAFLARFGVVVWVCVVLVLCVACVALYA